MYLSVKGVLIGFRKKMTLFCFQNKLRSHQVATVQMAPFDPKSASKMRFAVHSRYLIVVEAELRVPSFYVYLRSAFAKLLFLDIYRMPTCSDLLIAIDNMLTFFAHFVQDIPGKILSLLTNKT